MTETTNPVLLAIVTGIIIGVTTSILLGLGAWVHKLAQRREQVKFVRSCILKQFTAIRNLESNNPPREEGEHPPPGVFQKVIFESLLRELDLACSHRLTMLGYEEIHELRLKMAELHDMIKLFHNVSKWPTDNFYWQMYDGFAKVDWLRLPKDFFKDRRNPNAQH